MASPEAFAIIKGVFDNSWSGAPAAFENDGFTPGEPPAPWLFVEAVGDIFSQASIGGGDDRDDNLWRETGSLMVHVMVPNGTGSLIARQLGRDVASLFRGRDIGSMTFGDASLGAGQPGDDDGNYWRFTVTIDWQRDQ